MRAAQALFWFRCQRAVADLEVADERVRHERMFFRRAGQDAAVSRSFQIIPRDKMILTLAARLCLTSCEYHYNIRSRVFWTVDH